MLNDVNMLLPKPKRIVDKAAIKQARRDRCEVCGSTWGLAVHHIKTKASGGNDELSNLVCLCQICHTKAHNGQISKEKLKKIIGLKKLLS